MSVRFGNKNFTVLDTLNITDQFRYRDTLVDFSNQGDVLIGSLDDLPDPVGGVITLLPNTSYRIFGDVDIAPNRLEMNGNTTLYGQNPFIDILRSNTADPLLTVVDGLLVCDRVGFDVPNGPLLVSNKVSQFTGVGIFDCQIIAADTIGQFSGDLFGCRDSLFQSLNNGITINDNVSVVNLDNNSFFSYSGILLNLGLSLCQSVYFTHNTVQNVGGEILLAGLPNSNNIVSEGIVQNTISSTPIAGIVGVTAADRKWLFEGNNGYDDSRLNGESGFTNNITFTAFGALNDYVPVGGAATLSPLSQRFELFGDNGLKANTAIEGVKRVVSTFNVIKIAGGAQDYEFAIFRNGLQVSLPMPAQVFNLVLSFSIVATVEVNDDDEFELRVQAVTAAENIVVRDLTFSIA